MKFGTINEKGQNQIVVKIDEEHACKLTELEQLANIDCGQSILELIKITGEKKDFLLQLQKTLRHSKKIKISDFDWLPPIQNPSKILGVAFNNVELMRKAHRDPGVPNFFLKPPSSLQGHNKPIIVDPNWGAVIPEPEICAVI